MYRKRLGLSSRRHSARNEWLPRSSLTTQQVAEVLGISASKVRLRRNELRARKLKNGRLAFPIATVRLEAERCGRPWTAGASLGQGRNDGALRLRPNARRTTPKANSADRLVVYLLAVVIVLLIAGVASAVIGGVEHPTAQPTTTSVGSVAPLPQITPQTWTYVESTCADGWRSPSIGRRGACSHHGGVVLVFRGNLGDLVRCGARRVPPDAREQAQMMRDLGHLAC